MWGSLVAQIVKNLPAMWETWVQCLGWKDPLEKEMATHSSILAWRTPRTEEPGGLQSMGSQRVGQDWGVLCLCLWASRCPAQSQSSIPAQKEDKWSLLRASRSTRQSSGSQVLWEVEIEGRDACISIGSICLCSHQKMIRCLWAQDKLAAPRGSSLGARC